jgi:hypothetical protein
VISSTDRRSPGTHSPDAPPRTTGLYTWRLVAVGASFAVIAITACGSETRGLVLWESSAEAGAVDAMGADITLAMGLDTGGGDITLSDIADAGGDEVLAPGPSDACSGDAFIPTGPDAGVAIVLGQARLTQQHGGQGGNMNVDLCPSNQAVVGYQGFRTSPDAAMGLTVVGNIQTLCGALFLGGPASDQVMTGPGTPLDAGARGTTPDIPWDQSCPPNEVVVRFSGRSGQYLDQIEFECAHWTVSTACRSLSVDTTTMLAPAGGEGGVPFGAEACPPGQMATGTFTRSGFYVDDFGLVCETPTLVFQGGM